MFQQNQKFNLYNLKKNEVFLTVIKKYVLERIVDPILENKELN